MRGLEHKGAEKKDDDALAEEARQHVAREPSLQLVAELLVRLRAMRLAWWSPEVLRSRFRASERMAWLAERPDLRQGITSRLTGLAPKAARKKSPEFQAALIDSVLDEGDVTTEDFEAAFDPVHLATYGAADAFWRAFVELLPWDQNTREHQELAAFLIEALLASKSSLGGGAERKPILKAVDVRAAIEGGVWHTKLPLDVRVAIDRARLAKEREKPAESFGSEAELAIATPAVIAAALALRDLSPVFSSAEAAMDFSSAPKPAVQPAPQPAGRASAPEPPASAEVVPVVRPIPSTLPAAIQQAAAPPSIPPMQQAAPPTQQPSPVTSRSAPPPPPAAKSSDPQQAARESDAKSVGGPTIFGAPSTPRPSAAQSHGEAETRERPPARPQPFGGEPETRERSSNRPPPAFGPSPSTRPAPFPSTPPAAMQPFPPFPQTPGPRSTPPPLPPLPPLPQVTPSSHPASTDDSRPRDDASSTREVRSRPGGGPPPLPPMPGTQRPQAPSSDSSDPPKRPQSASSAAFEASLHTQLDFESTNPWEIEDSTDNSPTGVTKKPRN